MTTANNVFAIRNISRVDAQRIRISGDLILKGEFKETVTWDAPANSTSIDPTKKPPIKIPDLHTKLKWILPHRNSEWYDRIKGYAEGVGYETVDQDDFSYPDPRK